MTEEKRPLKVFLSYASQDKPVVRELSGRLAKEGWIDPWVDEKKLLPGQDWRTKIEEAVETSDIVIICLSTNSVTKEGFVQKELRYAREIAFEKPEETIFLVPLRLDDCTVPRGLRFYQWGDYFGEEKEETYSALLESLKLRYEQKLRLEEEERARQKKQIREREAAEKVAREKAEREAAEKLAQEKAAREKEERDAAEKAERKKTGSESIERLKPIEEKPAKKVYQAKPKLTETQTKQRKSGTQVAFWGIGFIAAIFIISVLFSNNGNKTLALPPASTDALLSTKTPESIVTSTKSLPSTPADLLTEITDANGVTMRLVPAGEFSMGSEEGEDDEQPAHQVYLDAFYMDIYEVTNALYRACVDAGKCTPPQDTSSYTRPNYYGKSQYDNYPVIYVDWNQAKTYCAWRSASLPTEAQWEKAARGTDGRTYPWGEGIDCNKANYTGNNTRCVGDTTKVGSYESGKSPYGIYDLAGNVWEWVADWYSDTYYKSSPSENPLGPGPVLYKVLRGGMWSNDENFLRTSDRGGNYLVNVSPYLGFRCVRLP